VLHLPARRGHRHPDLFVPGVEGRRAHVTSIEGLATGDQLHSVQEAWIEEDVAQCGFCQPGQIMTACTLLATKPQPTDDDIENICRCGTYYRIRAAIKNAAARMG